MKYRLRLLKDWTTPDGQKFAAGKCIEIEDKAVAGELLADGTAEVLKASVQEIDTPETAQKLAEAAVKAEIEKHAKESSVTKALAAEVHALSVKDRSDDDPTWGYLPPHADGRKHSKAEIAYGLGQFAADVFKAGRDMVRPNERLQKCIERSQKIIADGVKAGHVAKAAGDGLTVAVDSEVGAAIPPEFNTMLLDVASETAIIRPRATVLTTGAQLIELPLVKDTDRSGGLIHGGIAAYFKAEEAQLTESKPAMESVQLKLNKLTVLAYASDESMKFYPGDLGAYLLPKMADGITWKEEDRFINGSGAGEPLGFLTSGAKIAITAESGQTSSAQIVVVKNIDKMEARLRVNRAQNVVWLYNRPELFVWLRNLSRDVGTGGELARLFQFGGFGAGASNTLDGIPILDSEHMPAAATAGDLTLVDLSTYLIADHRSGPAISTSMHLKYDFAQDCWRILKYVDGQPMYRSALTRQKGSNTIAPVVTITTRS